MSRGGAQTHVAASLRVTRRLLLTLPLRDIKVVALPLSGTLNIQYHHQEFIATSSQNWAILKDNLKDK